jgi:hypothetical protein
MSMGRQRQHGSKVLVACFWFWLIERMANNSLAMILSTVEMFKLPDAQT